MEHQTDVPWLLIILVSLFAFWMMMETYRRHFGNHNAHLVRFEVDERAIVIEGPEQDVISAHYQVFHGKIDHRNQADTQDWLKPNWWTLGLVSHAWRREVHVVRADQFDNAVQLLYQAKKSGLKIDVTIRQMTAREARNTRNAESGREHDLYAEGQIGHPRDRAWLGGFFGPRRDKIRRVSHQQSKPSSTKTTQRAKRRK